MLDEVMPRYDVREYHDTILTAAPELAFASTLGMPAASDALVSVLFRLRGIRAGRRSLRELFDQLGFSPMTSTDRALYGIAHWSTIGISAAIAFWAEPLPERGTRLATETRVLAVDAGARRRFGLYWFVVGPFSALIRRRWLAAAKRRAEAASNR